MLDAYIIERLRKERQSQRIPLYAPLPKEPDPKEPDPKETDPRGVQDIDFTI